jgi:hypothetical protein
VEIDLSITKKMQRHIARIQKLRIAGLTVAHVVETFVRWRIVPLKRWDFLHLQRDP